jgi:hypothetical protein
LLGVCEVEQLSKSVICLLVFLVNCWYLCTVTSFVLKCCSWSFLGNGGNIKIQILGCCEKNCFHTTFVMMVCHHICMHASMNVCIHTFVGMYVHLSCYSTLKAPLWINRVWKVLLFRVLIKIWGVNFIFIKFDTTGYHLTQWPKYSSKNTENIKKKCWDKICSCSRQICCVYWYFIHTYSFCDNDH